MVITIIKTSLAFLTVCLSIGAQSTVFIDEYFPYRVVCKSEWTEVTKNDSILLLDKSTEGKKVRFQLKKYKIDRTLYPKDMDWATYTYITNKEFAIGVGGRIIYSESTPTKKLGSNQAFEMLAFFKSTTPTDTIWWVEYSRCTDYNGSGFFVSVIGDTTYMMDDGNYASYKTVLDSMSISHATRNIVLPMVRASVPLLSKQYNLLGQEIPEFIKYGNSLLVGKKMKRCLIK